MFQDKTSNTNYYHTVLSTDIEPLRYLHSQEFSVPLHNQHYLVDLVDQEKSGTQPPQPPTLTLKEKLKILNNITSPLFDIIDIRSNPNLLNKLDSIDIPKSKQSGFLIELEKALEYRTLEYILIGNFLKDVIEHFKDYSTSLPTVFDDINAKKFNYEQGILRYNNHLIFVSMIADEIRNRIEGANFKIQTNRGTMHYKFDRHPDVSLIINSLLSSIKSKLLAQGYEEANIYVMWDKFFYKDHKYAGVFNRIYNSAKERIKNRLDLVIRS